MNTHVRFESRIPRNRSDGHKNMKTILSIHAAVIGCAWVAVSANAALRYVNLNHATPNPPYTNWATAANIIQDAIDVAVDGDEIVVTNGVYQSGGAIVAGLSNRVAITKALTLRSVNGPSVTIIRGEFTPDSFLPGVRCVSLTNAPLGSDLDGNPRPCVCSRRFRTRTASRSGGTVLADRPISSTAVPISERCQPFPNSLNPS